MIVIEDSPVVPEGHGKNIEQALSKAINDNIWILQNLLGTLITLQGREINFKETQA